MSIEILKLATLNGFIEEFDKATGIDIRKFPEGTKVKVTTLYSTYDLKIVNPPESIIVISGSGKFFPHITRAYFSGSTLAGASLLKQGWITLDWGMEIYYDGERIITSTVKAIFINNVPILKSSIN